MDLESKQWLNVQHFDTLTAPIYQIGGHWKKITTSTSAVEGANAGAVAGAGAATPSTAAAGGQPGYKSATSSGATSSAGGTTTLSSTSTSSAATSGSSSSSSNINPMNQSSVEITLHDIGDLSNFDCLVFQNWYASFLDLYEVGPNKKEKLILHNYRMVRHPNFETDQQSYFALYRSQLDTTEFFSRPAGNRNVKLRAKLVQESPVWGQCSLRHVAAYKFVQAAAGGGAASGAENAAATGSGAAVGEPSESSGRGAPGGVGAVPSEAAGGGALSLSLSASSAAARSGADAQANPVVQLVAGFSQIAAAGAAGWEDGSDADEVWDVVLATGNDWRK